MNVVICIVTVKPNRSDIKLAVTCWLPPAQALKLRIHNLGFLLWKQYNADESQQRKEGYTLLYWVRRLNIPLAFRVEPAMMSLFTLV